MIIFRNLERGIDCIGVIFGLKQNFPETVSIQIREGNKSPPFLRGAVLGAAEERTRAQIRGWRIKGEKILGLLPSCLDVVDSQTEGLAFV